MMINQTGKSGCPKNCWQRLSPAISTLSLSFGVFLGFIHWFMHFSDSLIPLYFFMAFTLPAEKRDHVISTSRSPRFLGVSYI